MVVALDHHHPATSLTGMAVMKKFQGRRVPSPRIKKLIPTRWLQDQTEGHSEDFLSGGSLRLPDQHPPPRCSESGLQPPSPRLKHLRQGPTGIVVPTGLCALESPNRVALASAHDHRIPIRCTVHGPQLACPAGRLLAPWPPGRMSPVEKEAGAGPEPAPGPVGQAVTREAGSGRWWTRKRVGSSTVRGRAVEGGKLGRKPHASFFWSRGTAGFRTRPAPRGGDSGAPPLPAPEDQGLQTPAHPRPDLPVPRTHCSPCLPERL